MHIQLSQDSNSAKYKINSYENGKITINGQEYEGSIIVTPEKLIHVDLKSINDINETLLNEILTSKSEVLIIATEEKTRTPPMSLMKKNISFEIMNIAPACRTFSVLTSENRKVSLVII